MLELSKIKITLKSDLCSGSGQGFSGIIDTDVCHDKYGLPYIPARRLKGVLLEAAEYINIKPEVRNNIFGIRGDNQSGNLRLSNAVLNGYDALCENLKSGDCNLDSQKILMLYTSTKAQTAIENDHAKENSLRFTRVVNQYFNGEELCFYADCEIDEYVCCFKKICKAVRNIGLERTRGLGAVRLEFIEEKECVCSDDVLKCKNLLNNTSERCFLHYDIILDSPLMIPSISNGETIEYISGTAILGALAAEYLKADNCSDKDEKFSELFLKENVIFGNAYLEETIHAPLFLQKIKETNKIRTVFSKEKLKEDETPKPLKDAFVHPKSFEKSDIETEITYHHSRGSDSTLYTQKHLSSGQRFCGEIIGNGKDLTEIAKLLKNGLRIGRSKSAEYAVCSVKNIHVNNTMYEKIELKNGEKYVLTLESDFVCLDEYGNYSVGVDEVFRATGLYGDVLYDKSKPFIAVRRNAGYYTKWNLKKSHFVSMKAGSYIAFEYKGENTEIESVKYYGEKNNEGFGKIKFYRQSYLENFKFDVKTTAGESDSDSKCQSELYNDLKQKICENSQKEEIRLKAIEYANKKRCELIALNAAFIGRVALMINQSKDFKDLEARVKSIKMKSKKEMIQRIIDGTEIKDSCHWQEFLKVVFTLAKYWLKIDEAKAKEDKA